MIDFITKDVIDKYAAVQASAILAEDVILHIVSRYAFELDAFVLNAEEYLNGVRDSPTQAFDDGSLQRMSLRLPIILYRVCDGLDRAAIENDIAKAAVESIRSTNYLNAPDGTIPERKAYAELKTQDESVIVDLTKHVHHRLKNKIEQATALYDGIKKVLTGRDSERAIFLRETKR